MKYKVKFIYHFDSSETGDLPPQTVTAVVEASSPKDAVAKAETGEVYCPEFFTDIYTHISVREINSPL